MSGLNAALWACPAESGVDRSVPVLVVLVASRFVPELRLAGAIRARKVLGRPTDVFTELFGVQVRHEGFFPGSWVCGRAKRTRG
jgi:hypothetical protein